MNLLLEGNFIDSYGLMIALVVILVVMIIASYIRNRKFKNEAASLIEGLKVGDDVKTYSGFCGKIVAFGEVDGVKTAIISCDKQGYNGAFEIDINAIYSKTGILPEEQNQEVIESKPEIEAVVEEQSTEIEESEIKEEKPVKKSKKSKK